MKIKSIKNICLCVLVALLFFCNTAIAQSGLSMYHTNELFNASNYNPAFLSSEEKFTLSIFPLAGINTDFNDKEALQQISDLLFYDEVSDAMKDIFKNMVNKQLYYQHGEAALINFGYHNDFGSFNFVVKERVQLMLDFNGELSKFLMNTVDLRAKLDVIQEFPAEAIHFREYSVGYSNEIIENKLSVGGRAKLLYGKSFLSSDVKAAVVENSSMFYVVSKGVLNVSIPAERVNNASGNFRRLDPFANQTIGDYVMNTQNAGFAFDLGMKYNLTQDIELSASVIDIGSINWKSNLHSMEFDGAYELDATEVFVDNVDGVPTLSKIGTDVSLEEDISKLFGVPDVGDTLLSRSIPSTYYMGIKYKVNPDLHLGLVDRLVRSGNLAYNSIALTANYQINKRLMLVSGYSVHGNSYVNIPFGLFYKWQAGQAYISSDNMVSVFAPSISDFYGFSFGASFYILRPKMKYDYIDYLPFFKKKRKQNKTGKGLIFKAK